MIFRLFFLLFPFSLSPTGELYAEARARRVVTFSRRKVLNNARRKKEEKQEMAETVKQKELKKYTRKRTRKRIIR